jgi:hypothetical protein
MVDPSDGRRRAASDEGSDDYEEADPLHVRFVSL